MLTERLAALKARRAPSAAPAVDLSRPVLGSRVAVIDVETTGIDWREARVVEVAVVAIDGLGSARPEVVYQSRVNPGMPIPREATQVHGISDADVAGAPTWPEAWRAVSEAMAGRVPCAYNAAHDARVIGAECARHGLDVGPARWGAWLDPLVVARGLDQYERGKRLGDIARRRGVALDAHGAVGDAMVTAMLLPAIIRDATAGRRHRGGALFRAPGDGSLEAWMSWQRRAALAQERELAEWMRGRASVELPWHELEGVEAPAVPAPDVTPTSCRLCGAPIVWVVGQNGQPKACNPTPVRASERGEGRHLAVVLPSGKVRWGHLDPAGDIEGRESHLASCPKVGR